MRCVHAPHWFVVFVLVLAGMGSNAWAQAAQPQRVDVPQAATLEGVPTVRVDTTPLERAAADFQAKINEAVNADPKLSAYVRELKKREFEQ